MLEQEMKVSWIGGHTGGTQGPDRVKKKGHDMACNAMQCNAEASYNILCMHCSLLDLNWTTFVCFITEVHRTSIENKKNVWGKQYT